ncbi:hypothetical protein [Sphingobium lactosutens]|uniref:hypothetical protein n=1 Tax=Sphingobium lactosutens TaxID=522773 RepID=UPI0015B89D3B|nr:hypothetical protein [Sphingobium lactosutens]
MSEIGESLIAGLKEALAHARGEHVPGLRVHVIEVPVADDADTGAATDSGNAFAAIHASARALHRVGAIDAKAMAEFDQSCGVRPPNAEPRRSRPRR